MAATLPPRSVVYQASVAIFVLCVLAAAKRIQNMGSNPVFVPSQRCEQPIVCLPTRLCPKPSMGSSGRTKEKGQRH
jgi:hypothetical protein